MKPKKRTKEEIQIRLILTKVSEYLPVDLMYWVEKEMNEMVNETVNRNLDEAAEKAIEAFNENESNLTSVSMPARTEGLQNIKNSILSLKSKTK